MSQLEDVPLHGGSPGPAVPPPPAPARPEPSAGGGVPRWIWPLAGLLLVVIAGGIYLTVQPTPPPPAPPPPPAALPPVVEPPPPPLVLPDLDDSDAVVREQASGLSTDPELDLWLSPQNLIRRYTAAVDNVAEGVSPRPHLGFLAPRQPFTVRREGGRIYLDPASYQRFDAVADLIASVDTATLASLLRTFEPLVDQAYGELGYPQGNFEQTLGRAVGRLLQTPVLQGEVELKPQVTTYAFLDPRLEELTPAQKAFLRMGPRNMRLVQARLRDLARALGLPQEQLPTLTYTPSPE